MLYIAWLITCRGTCTCLHIYKTWPVLLSTIHVAHTLTRLLSLTSQLLTWNTTCSHVHVTCMSKEYND